MKHFRLSFFVTIICLALAFIYGGPAGLFAAGVLAVLEVSFSFDNAVVNASVLNSWDEKWRQIFLTLGMVIAVFGMRLIFPLMIVSQTTDLSLFASADLALHNPKEYSTLLLSHHNEIAAFGSMFLLLVFLNFLFDQEKDTHWHSWIETKLVSMGKDDTTSILIALAALTASLTLVDGSEKFKVLMAGVYGIMTYIGVNVLGNILDSEEESDGAVSDMVKKGSIGAFIYLEVLDASFSFDGVIGAFAITSDIIIIMLGLTIGAMFVRSMTIYLVDKGTLASYQYLEHGAHYAIGALALIMLAGMKFEVPEVVTGFIGVGFIVWSVISSIRENKASIA